MYRLQTKRQLSIAAQNWRNILYKQYNICKHKDSYLLQLWIEVTFLQAIQHLRNKINENNIQQQLYNKTT